MSAALYPGQSEKGKYPSASRADVLGGREVGGATGGSAAGVGGRKAGGEGERPELLSSRTCRSGRCGRLRFDLRLGSTGLKASRCAVRSGVTR